MLRLRHGSVNFEESAQSRRWHGTDEWGPEQIEFVFTAWLECLHNPCKQSYAVAGMGGIEQQYDGSDEGTTEWVECFYPRSIVPTLDIIELPARCPPWINAALRDAFSAYWGLPESSAGRIRVALEGLLTHIGIPETETSKSGKSVGVPLHRRIELYALENPTIGSQLMALKWLGNTGSHGRRITKPDLVDAFELLEHALVEVLEKRSEKMAALAKKLTDKHSPNGA